MQLITTHLVAAEIREVKPTHIAVAYVGEDWKQYIELSALREMIVSPTVGSNPRAIQQIAQHIGWENLHFLPNLHAKLYIGAERAAFGSFNLSRNGISGTGLEEFGAVTQDVEHLRTMREEFKRLRQNAIALFPDAAIKKEALRELRRRTQILDRAEVTEVGMGEASLSLQDYALLTDRDFYVAWYYDYTPLLVEEALAAHAPDVSAVDLRADRVPYCTFLEKDDIQLGEWILLWRADEATGMPYRRARPTWLHVGSVIPNGVKEERYSKLIVGYVGLKRHEPPFAVNDRKTASAIYRTLATEDMRALRPDGGEGWSIASSRSNLPRFLELAREHFANA